MKCGYCQFAEPFVNTDAEYVIDGQSVCEKHVDTASGTDGFGRSLLRLQLETR